MSEPTIEVHGTFGKPKHLTREQYINEWASHFNQVYNLASTLEDHVTIQDIIKTLRDMASRRWDEIREEENT